MKIPRWGLLFTAAVSVILISSCASAPPPVPEDVPAPKPDIFALVSEKNPTEIQSYLDEFGYSGEINETGNTPLHEAAAAGSIPVVEVLINGGLSLSAENEAGRTPLHTAAVSGHKELVLFLVSQGAELEKRDSSGKTPLHAALGEDKLETAELLLKSGAVLDSEDDEGNTPLMNALLSMAYSTAEFLAERGA
ncbi:MAG: ankyrin repeat domain-containing protein, partial [Spirochaetia bacterium]